MVARVWIATLLLLSLACGDDGAQGTSAGSTSTADGSSGPTTPTTGISESQTGDATETTTTDPSSGSSEPSTSEATTGSTTAGESGSGSSTTGPAECRLLLVEAVYDAEGGTDDQLQWVKLYNPCDETFDLTMFALGYGGPDYTDTLQLDLSVPAGGCFVVGGPMSSAANGNPDYQQFLDFAPDLELAMDVGGGIALFDMTAAAIDADTVPIDAVVYGPNNDNGLIDRTGTPVAAPHVGNHPPGGSIQRVDFGSNWETSDMPSPSECPPF